MPSALFTFAGRAAPGAVPASATPMVIIGITDGAAACSALVIEMMLLPLRSTTEVGVAVCVSFAPHWKHVICFVPGRSRIGVSGPTVSGLNVPAASDDSPGRCQENVVLFAAAISLCGHNSCHHA